MVDLEWLRRGYSRRARGGRGSFDGQPGAGPPDELPVWMTETLDRRREQERRQLRQLLDSITMQDLRSMARLRGWSVRGSRKAELIEQILPHLDDPESVRQAVAGLDPEYAQVLRALALLGDEWASPEGVLWVAGALGPASQSGHPVTTTRHLCELGLAFSWESMAESRSRVDVVPTALLRHFPPVLEDVIPSSDDAPAVGGDAAIRLGSGRALVRAANQLVSLLAQEPIPLRPPRSPTPEEEKHHYLQGWNYDPEEVARAEADGLLRRPGDNDPALSLAIPSSPWSEQALARLGPIVGGEPWLDFLYPLLSEIGVLKTGSPVTVWPEVRTEFLRLGESGQRALLARCYFNLSAWSELWPMLRADAGLRIKRSQRYAYYSEALLAYELSELRFRVLRALACLPDGRWIRLANLVPLLQLIWPRFEVMAPDTGRPLGVRRPWFLSRDGRPLESNNPIDWDAGQGAFVRQIISGPLHWFGLTDLCMDGERLVAFRLRGLADLYWDRVDVIGPSRGDDADEGPATAPVAAADDTSVVVNPGRASAEVHALLDRIARLEVIEPDRFVYRLDAKAVYQAFAGGAVLDAILAEWDEYLAVPIPPAMREQLLAWWQSYGRVRLYPNMTVIEFGDDVALAEMRAVTSLDQHLIAEVSPHLVIIQAEAVGRLLRELEKAGYTPKLQGDTGPDVPAPQRWD